MSGHRTNSRFYMLVRSLVRLSVSAATRWQIVGLENVPERGPYLLITNHLSTYDPLFIMAALPGPITVFAAMTHRHDFLVGELMTRLGAIWVRRGEVDRQALRAALEVLENGGIIGLAPEGTRSKTGALQQGKVGAAYLATRANVPLLPAVLVGPETITPSLKRLRRAAVTLTIGPPFRLPAAGRVSTAELDTYTDHIMHVLAGMLPDKYRGVYA